MAQVLDEALNAVEVLQKPSPKGQTGNWSARVIIELIRGSQGLKPMPKTDDVQEK